MNNFLDDLLDKHPALFFLIGGAGGVLFLLLWCRLIGVPFNGQVISIGGFCIAVTLFYGFETGRLK